MTGRTNDSRAGALGPCHRRFFGTTLSCHEPIDCLTCCILFFALRPSYPAYYLRHPEVLELQSLASFGEEKLARRNTRSPAVSPLAIRSLTHFTNITHHPMREFRCKAEATRRTVQRPCRPSPGTMARRPPSVTRRICNGAVRDASPRSQRALANFAGRKTSGTRKWS